MKTWEEMTERERYEMLCRGEVSIPPEVGKNLKCRYVDRGIPFLKIAPFKEEEAYLDPRIVVYHNVINDEEIETIKRMAQPRVNSPRLPEIIARCETNGGGGGFFSTSQWIEFSLEND